MNGIVSCMTDSQNIYTINKDKKILFLTHPNLVTYLHDLSKADGNDDYYARKALYLKKHGYLEKLNHQYEGFISPELVKKGISNLYQLVFEVTDSCNLRCKYCGFGELYNDYDARFTRKMKFEEAKSVIDFLMNTWDSSVQPQIRNYAHDMIQKRKESVSLVKRVHCADNVATQTHKIPLPHNAT